ncbi:MAG: VWA domain-containing protein [Alphaproteobacteria bacterium]|jgi:hypothetical protein|nr:VWA domain-containing protein [Alphaproteobacteria bacterium]
MAGDDKPVQKRPDDSGVKAFLDKVAGMPRVKPAGVRGRLLFAMDATASREPTWDMACQIQGDMFAETATLGGLDVQLVYYRGFHEFKATPWVSSSADLIPYMTRVRCLGGQTQLARAFRYAVSETKKQRINAMVFVGDAFEEDVDAVCAIAGELGMLNVPCFLFHEGPDPTAQAGFRQIAQLTKGAYCRFDANSASELKELLSAVAVFAAGGRPALADYSRRRGGAALRIAHQVE